MIRAIIFHLAFYISVNGTKCLHESFGKYQLQKMKFEINGQIVYLNSDTCINCQNPFSMYQSILYHGSKELAFFKDYGFWVNVDITNSWCRGKKHKTETGTVELFFDPHVMKSFWEDYDYGDYNGSIIHGPYCNIIPGNLFNVESSGIDQTSEFKVFVDGEIGLECKNGIITEYIQKNAFFKTFPKKEQRHSFQRYGFQRSHGTMVSFYDFVQKIEKYHHPDYNGTEIKETKLQKDMFPKSKHCFTGHRNFSIFVGDLSLISEHKDAIFGKNGHYIQFKKTQNLEIYSHETNQFVMVNFKKNQKFGHFSYRITNELTRSFELDYENDTFFHGTDSLKNYVICNNYFFANQSYSTPIVLKNDSTTYFFTKNCSLIISENGSTFDGTKEMYNRGIMCLENKVWTMQQFKIENLNFDAFFLLNYIPVPFLK